MGCAAGPGKREQEDGISPGSPFSSRLLAARDLPGCGQLLVQHRSDLPFQGWEEERGWCGSLGNPVASSVCRISTSWPGHRDEYPARLETAGDKSGQVGRRGPALCQGLDILTLFCSTGVRQVRPLPGAQASNHCFWGTATRSPSTCQEDLTWLHALNKAGLVPYLGVLGHEPDLTSQLGYLCQLRTRNLHCAPQRPLLPPAPSTHPLPP